MNSNVRKRQYNKKKGNKLLGERFQYNLFRFFTYVGPQNLFDYLIPGANLSNGPRLATRYFRETVLFIQDNVRIAARLMSTHRHKIHHLLCGCNDQSYIVTPCSCFIHSAMHQSSGGTQTQHEWLARTHRAGINDLCEPGRMGALLTINKATTSVREGIISPFDSPTTTTHPAFP